MVFKIINLLYLQLGNLKVTCLFTPCHTTGHICYFVEGESVDDLAVFTGVY